MSIVAPSMTVRLANRAPWLGRVRRQLIAVADAARAPRASYAQHGEDRWVRAQLGDLDLRGSIYVDVGASHPTRISNTYLLYRTGLRGVLVEPNAELAALLRRIRPRDVTVTAACGRAAGMARLHVASTPVLSSCLDDFAEARAGAATVRVDPVPMLPLDALLADVACDWISFLTIDVEGGDLDVLAGADETLRRTLFLCVEANDHAAEASIRSLLAGRFSVESRFGCNLMLRSLGLRAPRRSAS